MYFLALIPSPYVTLINWSVVSLIFISCYFSLFIFKSFFFFLLFLLFHQVWQIFYSQHTLLLQVGNDSHTIEFQFISLFTLLLVPLSFLELPWRSVPTAPNCLSCSRQVQFQVTFVVSGSIQCFRPLALQIQSFHLYLDRPAWARLVEDYFFHLSSSPFYARRAPLPLHCFLHLVLQVVYRRKYKKTIKYYWIGR